MARVKVYVDEKCCVKDATASGWHIWLHSDQVPSMTRVSDLRRAGSALASLPLLSHVFVCVPAMRMICNGATTLISPTN